MTIRNDVTIDWSVSPRIITVDSPSTEISIQDLYDTCMYLESLPDAIDEDHIIDCAGKEQLGGGTSVGLTATLLNALLAFEARTGPEYIQCAVNGGNLVALEADLITYATTPIYPTAFTQVVTTASSSATTTSQEQLEYSTFQNGVTIDVINGTSGTNYPIGTPETPVDNLTDAQAIASERGFSTLYVRGDITLDSTASLTNFIVIGQNAQITTITVDSAANVSNTEFQECTLTGTLDGGSLLRNGVAVDLNYINGFLFQCMINGTLTLGGGQQANMFDCFSGVAGTSTPTIDMGGSGQPLAIRGYNGGIKIINKTGTESCSLDINSGQVILDPTVTNGTIVVRGVATLTDNSVGATVIDQTINNVDVDINVAEIFNEDLSTYTTPGTFGEWLNNKGLTALKFMGLK